MEKVLVLLALLALGACGGVTTSASPTLKPVSKLVGDSELSGRVASGLNNGDQAAICVNQANCTTGVAIVGVDKNNNLTLGGRYGTFGGAQLASTGPSINTFAVVAFTDDGIAKTGQTSIVETTVIGSAAIGEGGQGFFQSAYYDRTSKSILPTSGSGKFKGDYWGTYGSPSGTIEGSGTGGLIVVYGEATLNATFSGNPRITDGKIRNRVGILVGGAPASTNFANVTLSGAKINNKGLFSGTASGGRYLGHGAGTTGSYQGLIGGPNGTNMAGALSIENGNYSEIGVFNAIRN